LRSFFQKTNVFGLLLAKEIESLNRVLNNSLNQVTAVLGGSKVSSKITVINILDKVDHMIIGGGMTFTFREST
jgi:phosphoglycerate kinase